MCFLLQMFDLHCAEFDTRMHLLKEESFSLLILNLSVILNSLDVNHGNQYATTTVMWKREASCVQHFLIYS